MRVTIKETLSKPIFEKNDEKEERTKELKDNIFKIS